MSIADTLLPEFDHEMANTRRALERVDGDKFSWAPHPKSMTLGALANHIATIPYWASVLVKEDSFDMAPPGGEPFRPPIASSRDELLSVFDSQIAAARAAIAVAPDDHLKKPWTLLQGGRAVLTMPRIALLRSFIMNHVIHHRGQLTVYFRLTDIPVPSLYGPSADERGA